MQLIQYLAAGLVTGVVTAKATLARRAVECDFAAAPGSGATCEGFAGSWGVSIKNLQQLNPGMSCPSLDASREYCVFGTVNDKPEPQPQPTTTFKTSTTRAPPTTTKAPVQSNQPQMPGIAKDCDTFHKVASGDQCDTIAKQYGISQSQLREWNSEINNGKF